MTAVRFRATGLGGQGSKVNRTMVRVALMALVFMARKVVLVHCGIGCLGLRFDVCKNKEKLLEIRPMPFGMQIKVWKHTCVFMSM